MKCSCITINSVEKFSQYRRNCMSNQYFPIFASFIVSFSDSQLYRINGQSNLKAEACFKYSIQLLLLTEGDRHQIQLEGSHVPKPKVSSDKYTFALPIGDHIV
jgi:hypothetical protein